MRHSRFLRGFVRAPILHTYQVLSVLVLFWTGPVAAQTENSPTGSVYVEGSVCASSDLACGAGESFVPSVDLKLKGSIPVLFFENTGGNVGDRKEWYIQTDFDRFRLYDYGVSGSTNTEVLGIESGAPANSLRITAAGSVGLGTFVPQQSLHIVQNGFPGIRIQNESQSWDIEADNVSFAIANANLDTRPLQIVPGARDAAIAVDANGDVGFGTTTPAAALHIKRGVAPAIRLDQGAPAQIWDLQGTQLNFTVRDVSAATVPFAVTHGAPDSSVFISATGDVGIGNEEPIQAVDVMRTGAAARFQLTSFTNDATQAPQFIQRRARGSSVSPGSIMNNDNLGLFSFRGWNGIQMTGSRATITAQAADNWTDFSNPTRLLFGTTPVGSTTVQSVLEITPDAKVRINGATLNVPDYVFEEDYALMPLAELRAFIDANGHLPGIAPADQVQTEGLDLAGSQMGLLQKVEELTLYTLQQEAELLSLRAKVARLEREQDDSVALRGAIQELRSSLDELRRLGGLPVHRLASAGPEATGAELH